MNPTFLLEILTRIQRNILGICTTISHFLLYHANEHVVAILSWQMTEREAKALPPLHYGPDENWAV